MEKPGDSAPYWNERRLFRPAPILELRAAQCLEE